MTDKAFLITTPQDLLQKLLEEFNDFSANPKSSRHAINFTLTAYHLREWIWHSILKNNKVICGTISTHIIDESTFNSFINQSCKQFVLIHELANNIKHFSLRNDPNQVAKVRGQAKWEEIDTTWEKLNIPWDYDGLVLVMNDDEWISVLDFFRDIKQFWEDFFKNYL